MLQLRKSRDRGHADHGWLVSKHTFSFADYHDPAFKRFRKLRVINEDFIQPGQGFDTHSHADMEIVTYVLRGALAHKDSMGNSSVILPGEVQRMSAGSGITHSEYNHSKNESVHLLQIWIHPSRLGLIPGYEQKAFSREAKQNQFCLVASEDGDRGSVEIHQNVKIYASIFTKDFQSDFPVHPGRYLWLHLIQGDLEVNEQRIETGDAVYGSQPEILKIRARADSEFLLFDLV